MGRPPLNIIPKAPMPWDQVNDIIKSGGFRSVADLMRRTGRTRKELNDAIKLLCPNRVRLGPGRPPKEGPPPFVPAPAAPAPTPVPHSTETIILGWFMGLCACGLAGVGMWFNFTYWYSFGHSLAFGVTGFTLDGFTVSLPTIAIELCRRRHWVQGPAAAILFVPCAWMSLNASMGFSATRMGDTFQGRETIVMQRHALESEQTVLKARQAVFAHCYTDEANKFPHCKNPDSIEQDIQAAQTDVPYLNWKSSQGCTSVTISVQCLPVVRLREAKAQALERLKIEARLAAIPQEIASLPAIEAVDGGADNMSEITGIPVWQIKSVRLKGFAGAPILSGIFFGFATTLLRRRPTA